MNAGQRYHRRNSGTLRPGRKRRGAFFVAGVAAGTALVILIFFVVNNALGRSDFFQITTIKINGCEKVSKQRVLEYSEVDIHSNLFSLDDAAVKAKVESGSWIRRAEIDKHWPNRLDITVKEYSPVAMVNLGGSLHYVDRLGNAFAEATPPGDIDYPVVTGISGVAATDLYKEKAIQEALRFIKYASTGNLNLPVQNISEINVHDLDDAVLYLVDRPFPIRLGVMGKGLKTKYSRLTRVLAWLYRQKKIALTDCISIGHMNEKILVGQRAL